ncbi:MAG: DNA recombination protein RmuC [Alphaproteobacteria bacterium]|nr:DNA recombination protein RmuC [Alphaproteobacteria bacterium]MBF0251435.1 DNA recombination protein RmuC [Alphaproteobacteria bacterium]
MDTMQLVILVLAGAALAVALWAAAARRGSGADGGDQEWALEGALKQLALAQAELTGRLQAMGESQAQMSRTMEERLDAVTRRLGDGLTEHSQRTGDVIKQVHERLALIDAAQKNLASLTDQVVGLQEILSNKQARGAFGEIQLNDLVSDVLPPSAYEFQATLKNGKRADCLLKLPNPPGAIVIDSKFPLESYQAVRAARGDEERVRALRAFGTDVMTHVRAIAEKYIVPGETAESALMFLPSEAVYAELHAALPDVVEKSYRARVWIVSPTTLMATLNTVRAVLKDARMREQAGVIQVEVLKLLEDVARLDQRVEKLGTHFSQAQKDVADIQISSSKIARRAERIEDIQLQDANVAEDLPPRVASGDT